MVKLVRTIRQILMPAPGISDRGFTLLEVMVSMAILGVGIAMVMELFAGSVRSIILTEDYSKAVILAEQKMESKLLERLDGPSSEAGEYDEPAGYKWSVDVTDYDSPISRIETNTPGVPAPGGPIPPPPPKLMKIRVRVGWASNPSAVDIETLKLVIPSPQGFL